MALLKSEEEALEKGDKALDFSLKNVDGEIVSLKDFEGRPLAVIFMCNHCPYVKPKMEEIGKLQEEFKDVAIICVNSNDAENYPEDSFGNMKRVAAEFGYDYYLYDESQNVAKSYGAVCTPDPFLFDKNHRLVYHGRINDAMSPSDVPIRHDLKEVIIAVLEKREVHDWFRPSMGCSIKWKA